MAVHASQIFGTQEFFEDFRKSRGRPVSTSYSENSAPVPNPSPQPAEALPTSPSLPPPSASPSARPSVPTLIRYTAVPTPSEPIPSNVFTAGGARINREIQPEDMVIIKINSEANDGEVTMLSQVSLEEQENDLEDYIEDVFQERLDTQASEKVDTVAQFGQEWDVMEDYIDLNVAPTSMHVVDTDMMVTNDLTDERNEDIIYEDSGLVSAGQERFGQQWDIMEDYVDENRNYEDSVSEYGDYDETLRSDEGYLVYSQDDYGPADENQILSLNAEISSQEENPYYSHHNPMVHEHLQDYDYSGYIPNINAEYVDLYGSINEDSFGYEPASIPSVSNDVALNHLDKDDIQHRDMQSRNQQSEILSEVIADETSTSSIALESEDMTTESVTAASSDSTTAEANDEETTTTEQSSTTTQSTTTATTEENTTHLPELAPEGVLISEDLTLPPGLEALNLVTEKVEAPSEKALRLPDAEPLVSKNVEDEFFVLPAGHGLRFKFKIRDLDYYNPVFGFQSK